MSVDKKTQGEGWSIHTHTPTMHHTPSVAFQAHKGASPTRKSISCRLAAACLWVCVATVVHLLQLGVFCHRALCLPSEDVRLCVLSYKKQNNSAASHGPAVLVWLSSTPEHDNLLPFSYSSSSTFCLLVHLFFIFNGRRVKSGTLGISVDFI